MTGQKIPDSKRWKHRRRAAPQTVSITAPVPAPDYSLAYRTRLASIGLDAQKEEFQLRALEAVVNLYRSHHPDADIDTAKAAVLAAIAAAKLKEKA